MGLNELSIDKLTNRRAGWYGESREGTPFQPSLCLYSFTVYCLSRV